MIKAFTNNGSCCFPKKTVNFTEDQKKTFVKIAAGILRNVGVAECEGCRVWGWQCGGCRVLGLGRVSVTVCGGYSVLELRCLGVALLWRVRVSVGVTT